MNESTYYDIGGEFGQLAGLAWGLNLFLGKGGVST